MLPMNTAFFHFFIPHVYGSLWCLKHWSVRQINNNNTSICKAHNVSIRAESEAPAVARWRGWLEG